VENEAYIMAHAIGALMQNAGGLNITNEMRRSIIESAGQTTEKAMIRLKNLNRDVPDLLYEISNILMICKQRCDDSARLDEIAAICARILK